MQDPTPQAGGQPPIALGLVGLGTIARAQHLPAIAATPGLALAAIASRHGGLDGLPHYTDVTDMLAGEPGLRAVTLCTPPQGRFEQALAVIRAGRHLMIEKPPGMGVAEVQALAGMAELAGVSLFTTWHSREAAAVDLARDWLAEHPARRMTITWREDVRRWHPGQQWIWEPGGLGVFDPGINALSILTRIVAAPLRVAGATLTYPANRAAPIAAALQLSSPTGLSVACDFDWRQEGPQTWEIRAETAAGEMLLADGGSRLVLAGVEQMAAPDTEYRRLYERFARLIAERRSEVDLRPLQLVADAFLLGRRAETAAFDDDAGGDA